MKALRCKAGREEKRRGRGGQQREGSGDGRGSGVWEGEGIAHLWQHEDVGFYLEGGKAIGNTQLREREITGVRMEWERWIIQAQYFRKA